MNDQQRVRYDMPAAFGPSLMSPATHVDDALAVIVSFETDPAALAKLLPRHFRLAEPAVVTVSRINYPTTDYMGGRGYEEIVLTFSATHGEGENRIKAGFAPVLWVNQFGALFSGREFQGLAKLLADVPPIDRGDSSLSFECLEYGAPVLRGSVQNLEPITGERFEAVRKASAEVPTFGWKYIPSPTSTPDADYPTVNYTLWDYEEAWTGEGRVDFCTPSAVEAPFSSRIVAALAALPVERWKRAFVGRGTVIIDRTMTRRLDC